MSLADILWEEGMEKKNIEVIRNAMKKGLSLDSTEMLTGLTIEEVEKIVAEIKS